MASITRSLDAPLDDVVAVMSDGWSYASWVVGASRVRAVDNGWPEPGGRIHHSVGVWPLVLDDTTTVLDSTLSASSGPRRLVLQARAWPAGEATVAFELTADGDGTQVTISEDATRGPGTLLPRPLRSALLIPRNHETLRRLGLIAGGRTHAPSDRPAG
jgi:hypothetical protein